MSLSFDSALSNGMLPTLFKDVLDEFEIKEAWGLDVPSTPMEDPYSQRSQSVEQPPQDIQSLDNEGLKARWQELNESMRVLGSWCINHAEEIAKRNTKIHHIYHRTTRSLTSQRESVVLRTMDRLEGIFVATDPHMTVDPLDVLPPVPHARMSPVDGKIVVDEGIVGARPLTLASMEASASIMPQGLQEVTRNKLTVLQLVDIVPKIIEYLEDDTVPRYEKITNAAWILQKSDEDCPRGVLQLFDTILQESKLNKLSHLIAQFRGEICDAIVTEHMHLLDINDGVQVHFRAEMITVANALNWNIPDPRRSMEIDTREKYGYLRRSRKMDTQEEYSDPPRLKKTAAQEKYLKDSKDKGLHEYAKRFFIAALSDDFRYKYNLIGGIHFLERGFLEKTKKLCKDRGIACESTSDRLQLSQHGFHLLKEGIDLLARSYQIITAGEDVLSCRGLFSVQLPPQYEDIVDENITSLNSNFALKFLDSVAQLTQDESALCPHTLYVYPEQQPSSSQKRYLGRYLSSFRSEKTICFEYGLFEAMKRLIRGGDHEKIKQIITDQLFIRSMRRDVLKWLLLCACTNHEILRAPEKDAAIAEIAQGFATSSPVVAQIKKEGKDCDVRIYFVNGNNDLGVFSEDPYRGILLYVEEERTQIPLDINALDIKQFEAILEAILHDTLDLYLNLLCQLYSSTTVGNKISVRALSETSAQAILKKECADYQCITLCWYIVDFCLKLISRYCTEHFRDLLTKHCVKNMSISSIFMMLFTLKFASSFFSNVYERDLSKLTHEDIKGALEFYAVARNDMPLWERVQTLPPEGPVWRIFPISLPVRPSILIEKLPATANPYIQVHPPTGADVFGDYILQITAFSEEVHLSGRIADRTYTQKIRKEEMPFYQEVLDREDPKDISTPALTCIMEHVKEFDSHRRCQEWDSYLSSYPWIDCPWTPLRHFASQTEQEGISGGLGKVLERCISARLPLPVRKFSLLIPTELFFMSSSCVNRMNFLQKNVEMIRGFKGLSSHFDCKPLKNLHPERELSPGREDFPPPVDVIFRKQGATSSTEEWEKIAALQEAITHIHARDLSELGPLEAIRRPKDPIRVLTSARSPRRAHTSEILSSAPASKRRKL